MTARQRQSLADWLTVGLPLALLYFATLQRTVGTIDSGELGAVSVLLGVAHPTGYPVYSLLGRVAVMLAPTGAELPFLAGLSALAVILASLAFVSLLRAIFRLAAACPRAGSGRGVQPAAPTHPPGQDWAARVGGVVLGTSTVAWTQAVTNEVYGLHLLAVVLIAWFGIRLLGHRGAGERAVLILAYIVGLACGNHLSIVFLGPATLFALLFWLRRAPPPAPVKALGRAALVGLLGLSALLYLPIRSSCQPLLDWGDPETLSSFLRHVQAVQYQVWHFQSSERFFENFRGYVVAFPSAVGWPTLALFPWGLYVLIRRWPAAAIHLGLIAVVTLVWASGYEIFDLEPYYLPADAVAIAFAMVGVVDLLSRIFGGTTRGGGRLRALRATGVLLLVGIALLQVVLRYPEVDRSRDQVVRFHVDAVLGTVPERSILLSAFWDAVVSPLLYVQMVEGERPDLTVVDPELLRRSWYYPQLERWDPELLRPLRSEADAFLTALAPFESGSAYDADRLERAYRAVIEEIAHSHRPERPTVFTADVPPAFARGVAPVPEGLVYVLRDTPASSPRLGPPDVDGLLASGFRPGDRTHRQIIDLWVRMIRSRVVFLERFGRQDEADEWNAELDKLTPLWLPDR